MNQLFSRYINMKYVLAIVWGMIIILIAACDNEPMYWEQYDNPSFNRHENGVYIIGVEGPHPVAQIVICGSKVDTLGNTLSSTHSFIGNEIPAGNVAMIELPRTIKKTGELVHGKSRGICSIGYDSNLWVPIGLVAEEIKDQGPGIYYLGTINTKYTRMELVNNSQLEEMYTPEITEGVSAEVKKAVKKYSDKKHINFTIQ